MDMKNLLQYVRVTIMQSREPLYLERAPFNSDPRHLLSQLFMEVLIAVATTNHLIAPLYALYDHDSFVLEDFQTSASRQAYYQLHADILIKVGVELLQRFARTPIQILVVDTSEPRWAAVLNAPGSEHTIVVEERLVKVVLADTPEARLFGFAVAYHEIGHLFRRWYCAERSVLPFTPKKICPPGYKTKPDDRGEAGAFVEWAGLGGFTGWMNNQLYIQSSNQCHWLTTEEAQSWWNSKRHPHLVEFIEERMQSLTCSPSSSILDPVSGNLNPFVALPSTPPAISPSEQLSDRIPTISSDGSPSHQLSSPSRTPAVISDEDPPVTTIRPHGSSLVKRPNRNRHLRYSPYKSSESHSEDIQESLYTMLPTNSESDAIVGSFTSPTMHFTSSSSSVIAEKDTPVWVRSGTMNGLIYCPAVTLERVESDTTS